MDFVQCIEPSKMIPVFSMDFGGIFENGGHLRWYQVGSYPKIIVIINTVLLQIVLLL